MIKKMILFTLLIKVSLSFSQTILTGNINYNDLPSEIIEEINANNISELEQRIEDGGELILRDAKLTIPKEVGSVFLTLTRLKLENSEIITNGNEINILSKEIISTNSKVISFENGSKKEGEYGSNINLFNITKFEGNLTIDIRGNDGKNGSNGYNGKNSRVRRWVDCNRHAQSGGNGKNGQNGGDGGILRIYTIYNPVNFNQNFLTLINDGGNAGKGGKGGKGGKNSGPCKVSRSKYAANGKNGKDGKVGKKGKLEIKKFKLEDLI